MLARCSCAWSRSAPPGALVAAAARLRRATRPADDGVTVVATTTQAADLARNVGGAGRRGRAAARAERRPARLRGPPARRQRARRRRPVVRSGGDVDEWLEEAIEGSGSDAPVADAERRRRAAWRRPALVAGPAQRDHRRRASSSARCDRHARRRYDEHGSQQLDRDRSPPASPRSRAAQRKLVTTHDALGYYAAPLRHRRHRRRDPVALHARASRPPATSPTLVAHDPRARA